MSKVVKKEGARPCGCYVVQYSDESQDTSPCVPHGLQILGVHLMKAGEAAMAMAERIVKEQQQVQMAQAVAAAAGQGPRIVKP